MGIGEAIAESLSREGAKVALLSRSEASHKWSFSEYISEMALLTIATGQIGRYCQETKRPSHWRSMRVSDSGCWRLRLN